MNKRNRIIYWIATIWLSLGMVSTGIVQLMKGKEGQGGLNTITSLGYPEYILTMLGICKILGVIVLLIPKFPIVKEWAYAGFCFIMLGAIFSHMASGYTAGFIPALLLLVLTGISWWFRPESRKIISPNR
jgi:hypothetical protein